ncbi:hypothetical protein B9G55_14620 [Saccharibacillus sp. O16]|nr:hypothetical protein B9G55_14620 [Saccharibacillus sp. O16]
MNHSAIQDPIQGGEPSPFRLEGPDILLREFVPADLDDFCEITAQPHIREFLPDWHVEKETRRVWLRDYEIPGSREFLEAAAQSRSVEDRMLRLAVIERSSGRFVGWCCTGIKDELPQPSREIVYGLSAACQGRGYITQAVTLLVDWLFAHTDIRLIHGLARPANVASNRVLQKCGFQPLGEIRLEDGRFLHYVLEKSVHGTPELKRKIKQTQPMDLPNEMTAAKLPHMGELYLQKATAEDAENICTLMSEIEADETRRWYTNGERPYIPGFNSLSMQIYQMREGLYDKIMLGEQLAGVVLVSTTGREHGRIDRLYLAPCMQGLGLGSQALKLIENKYPRIIEWSLDTIKCSPRNLHFYEKNGYERTGEDDEEVYYTKKIGAAGKVGAADRPTMSLACEGDTSSNSTKPQSKRDSEADFTYIPSVCRTDDALPIDLRFENHSFTRADFRRCDLTETDFMGGDLSRSTYSHLNMTQIAFNNCNLQGTKITNANLRGSRIGDSSMDGSEILHVSLRGSSIRECDLSDVRLANCDYAGMTIDGIPVSELLDIYRNRKRSNAT